ncbi:GNAT family N-acetyltransferase [bacterium]|nr:GNAT family N-acetyltransferase [bacterium]
MNQNKLVANNIDNLIAFWAACGAETNTTPNGATLHISNNWPNRAWFAHQDQPTEPDVASLIQQAKQSDSQCKIPNWHPEDQCIHNTLIQADYKIGMTQELMAMPLAKLHDLPDCSLSLREVNNQQGAELWASVAGDSFGYYIHAPVIMGLIDLPGFELVIAYHNETPVGSGMILQTDNVAGIHMIGVPRAHRRKGYARQIMFGLLARAKQLECEFATLQASAAGEPLYRQLGFESQGPVHTYRKK